MSGIDQFAKNVLTFWSQNDLQGVLHSGIGGRVLIVRITSGGILVRNKEFGDSLLALAGGGC